jgi:YcaO-like protein with predicted kinase domain
LAPAVAAIIAEMFPNCRVEPSLLERPDFPLIDLATLPPKQSILVRKMRDAGLLVYVRNITCTGGVPAVNCTIVERRPDGRHAAHGGTGAHPDARVAVSRALTEAAQSRVGHIQGGREDLPQIVRTPAVYEPDEVYGQGNVDPFDAIESHEHPNIDDDISFLLDRLRSEGFAQVVAVDLTRREVGIPVVRVIIPGAEAWSVFFTHTRRAVLGPRVKNILCNALRGMLN